MPLQSHVQNVNCLTVHVPVVTPQKKCDLSDVTFQISRLECSRTFYPFSAPAAKAQSTQRGAEVAPRHGAVVGTMAGERRQADVETAPAATYSAGDATADRNSLLRGSTAHRAGGYGTTDGSSHSRYGGHTTPVESSEEPEARPDSQILTPHPTP